MAVRSNRIVDFERECELTFYSLYMYTFTQKLRLSSFARGSIEYYCSRVDLITAEYSQLTGHFAMCEEHLSDSYSGGT